MLQGLRDSSESKLHALYAFFWILYALVEGAWLLKMVALCPCAMTLPFGRVLRSTFLRLPL
jgi:hypothetical protein